MLKIEFGKTNSPNLSKAIELASLFSNFSSDMSNGHFVINIKSDEIIEKFTIIQKLCFFISSWKRTKCYYFDSEIDNDFIDSFSQVITCYNNYLKTPLADKHCLTNEVKEGWSCKCLDRVHRYIPQVCDYRYRDWVYYFDFGYFENQETWVVDKNKLWQYLQKEIAQKRCLICPIFSENKVKEAVNKLPDKISLDNNPYLEIVIEHISDGVTIEERAVKIKPKGLDDGIVGKLSFPINLNVSSSVETNEKTEKRKRFIPNTTYQDIGGIDDVIQTIREVVELPMIKPELFSFLGIKPHKGILLYGAPGCGKTLIAKAIANEINAHFISIKGPELFCKYHGQSEENLRNIFEEGRELAPSIIFFDEIDSIAQKRSSEEHLRFDSRFVNQLLTLMDGVEEFGSLCVIASTNRLDLLDEAILRPGRFDYSIEICKPNIFGCKKIFEIHTSKMPIARLFNIDNFCSKLVGLSGADIAFIAREAAYNCLRRSIDLNMMFHKSNDSFNFNNLEVSEFDFLKALKKARPYHEDS